MGEAASVNEGCVMETSTEQHSDSGPAGWEVVLANSLEGTACNLISGSVISRAAEEGPAMLPGCAVHSSVQHRQDRHSFTLAFGLRRGHLLEEMSFWPSPLGCCTFSLGLSSRQGACYRDRSGWGSCYLHRII